MDYMKYDGIKLGIVCNYVVVWSGIVAEGENVKADELFDELLVLELV